MYSFFFIKGGYLKNIKVFFVHSKGLRPSKSNVRHFFISLLSNDLKNLYIIDLFTGSGILDFELISLGARKLFMLEKSIATYRVLLKNLYLLKKKKVFLFNIDSLLWLRRFNILNISFIFFDPPYSLLNISTYIKILCKIKILRLSCFIFFETHSDDLLGFIPLDWFLLKKLKTGNTFIYFFKKI